MAHARRRRRPTGTLEQLTFCLAPPAAPEVPVELLDVGYFTAVRMSTGVWWLTVGPKKSAYAGEERTPQAWWRDVAPELFTLHGWSSDGRYIQNERDEPDMEPVFYETKVSAARWLRAFNEAYQAWRMEAWT